MEGLAKYEKRYLYRSLNLLVKSLENELVTVDLRNETSVSGLLEFVDSGMNLTFQDAAYVEEEGSYQYFTTLFVPCRMIRDVIIPSHKPIALTLRDMLPRKPQPRPPKPAAKKPMTFKRSRAEKQQAATKLLVQKILKERREAAEAGPSTSSAPD